jgi:hypothetical protein
MGPVEPSHYQGLWEARQGRHQDQEQQEEEEEQSFIMELVRVSSIYCSEFAHMLLPDCAHVLPWCPR